MESLKEFICDLKLEKKFENDISFKKLHQLYNEKSHSIIRDKMRRMKTCFLQLITDVMEHSPFERKMLEAIAKRICLIFGDQIEFTVKEILEILDVESTFCSNFFLKLFFEKYRHKFEIIEHNHGLLIKPVGFSKNHYNYLMKNHYDVMKKLLCEFSDFEDFVIAYDFWTKDCMEISSYLHWLFTMAKYKFVENFKLFQDNIRVKMALKIMDILSEDELKISRIRKTICENYPGLATDMQIYEIVRSQLTYFEIKKNAGDLSTWVVCIDNEKKYKVLNNNVAESVIEAERIKEITPQTFEIKLNEEQEKRVTPLLTLKVKFDNIVNIFKSLKKKGFDSLITDILDKYGCFFNFLIEYCKFQKPKINHAQYKDTLNNLVKNEIYKILNDSPGYMPIGTIMDKISNYSSVNEEYVRQVIDASGELFHGFENIVALTTVDIDHVKEENRNDERRMRKYGLFKLLDLCVKLRHIKRFFEDCDRDLKVHLKSVSMCFLEYLAKASQKFRKNISEEYIKHLCRITNDELFYYLKKVHRSTLTALCASINGSSSLFVSTTFLAFSLRQISNPDICLSSDSTWVEMAHSRYSKKSRVKQEPKAPLREFLKQGIPLSRLNIEIQQLLTTYPSFNEIVHFMRIQEQKNVSLALSEHNTWFQCLLKNSKEVKISDHVVGLIKNEVLKAIPHILPLRNLISIFDNIFTMLVSPQDLLDNVLEKFPHVFVIHKNEHGECVIGLRRKLNARNEIDFSSNLEKQALYELLLCTTEESVTETNDLWRKLLHCTQDVQNFIFGEQRQTSLAYARFEVFIKTFQCLLYKHDDNRLSLTVPGLHFKKEAIQMTINGANSFPESVATSSNTNSSQHSPMDKRPSEDAMLPDSKRIKQEDSPIAVKTEMVDTDIKPAIQNGEFACVADIDSLKPKNVIALSIAILKKENNFTMAILPFLKLLISAALSDSQKSVILSSNYLNGYFLQKITPMFPKDIFTLIYEDTNRLRGIQLQRDYKEKQRKHTLFEFFGNPQLYDNDFTATEMVALAHDFFLESAPEDSFVRRRDAFTGYAFSIFLKCNKQYYLTNRSGSPGLTILNFVKDGDSNKLKRYRHDYSLLMNFIRDFSIHVIQHSSGLPMSILVNEILKQDFIKTEMSRLQPQDLYEETYAIVCASLYQSPFHYPLDTENVLLRPTKRPKKEDDSWKRFNASKEEFNRNPKLAQALLALTSVVERHTCTTSTLSKIWMNHGPPTLTKILGNEMSFRISYQKYDFLFIVDKMKKVHIQKDIVEELKKIAKESQI